MFSDGKPLGDAETQQWLRSIRVGAETAISEPVVPTVGHDENPMGDAFQTALDLAKNKKVREAVSMMQIGLQRSFSKQERLLWRLGLSQILLNAKKPALARPHLETVLQDIDAYHLEQWDPGLALKGLKMVWQGLSAFPEEAEKKRAEAVLDRIARLDPAEALVFAT